MSPSPKRLLTPNECSIIHKLRKSGMPIHLIGKEIHRSKNLVSMYLRYPDQYMDTSPEALKMKMAKARNRKSIAKATPSKAKASPAKKVVKKVQKAKTPSEEDTKRFNKVGVEHRAVIKYLTKKGIGARCIYDDMQSVYGQPAPDMDSVQFWCNQYKKGRESIINDSRIAARALAKTLANGRTPKARSTASTKSSRSLTIPKSSADKKLITIKFNNVKRHKT